VRRLFDEPACLTRRTFGQRFGSPRPQAVNFAWHAGARLISASEPVGYSIQLGMDLQLRGKLALITGSTGGIGFAIAESLAREGCQVIVNGRTQKRVDAALAKLAGTLGPSASALGFAADLGTSQGVLQIVARFPKVDILVNNMGIFEPKPFEEIPDADWLRFFEVNVLSGVRLSRHYLPRMRTAGWGRIIFISSESAIQIPAEMIHYGMTKTAQLAVSRGLAETTGGSGVTVNSVLPGPTASEGVEGFVDNMAANRGTDRATIEREFFQNVRPSSLLLRFATPEEVAAMVTFVASPLSAATNGAALRVDGGVVRSII
jgi:NAD(P)-dependent dehydrogenase (short-subunit alcohol dehydrogenase family)